MVSIIAQRTVLYNTRYEYSTLNILRVLYEYGTFALNKTGQDRLGYEFKTAKDRQKLLTLSPYKNEKVAAAAKLSIPMQGRGGGEGRGGEGRGGRLYKYGTAESNEGPVDDNCTAMDCFAGRNSTLLRPAESTDGPVEGN